MQKRILSCIGIALLVSILGTTIVDAQRVRNTPTGSGTATVTQDDDDALTPADDDAALTPANCDPAKTKCPSTTGTGDGFNVKLKNPLKVNTIQEAVRFFINTLLKIAIPFIVIFFIWSGLNFILAQGNKEKVQKAKNMFLNTIIGTLLILGAWAITNAIVGTVNSIANTETTITK